MEKCVAHHKTGFMVMEAVDKLQGKGGVSLKGIKKYIKDVHEVDVEKKAHSIRKAITKALANGELIQMKGSGPNGTFKLPLKVKDVVKPSLSEPSAEEKPFKCHVCNGGYSKSKRLRRHLKFIHGEKGNNNEEEEDGSIPPDFRLMIFGALEFLSEWNNPMTYQGASYEPINRIVQETFKVRSDCLKVLNEMVREGILSLSDDRTYSKNSLHVYWSNEELEVVSGDSGKVRTSRKRRRSFAKSVVGEEGTPAFDEFSSFLMTEEGEKCLQVLKGVGVILNNFSTLLNRAGAKTPKAFKDLYDQWFDQEGNKTQYLETLEGLGLNLASMSCI